MEATKKIPCCDKIDTNRILLMTKINLQTFACDKIANTEFLLSLTSQIDVIIESVFYPSG